MRVLVACEYSGKVRDAFTALGHEAWSCDILPSESKGKHIQGDVLDMLGGFCGGKWDVLLAFPPCTYLTVSANKWYKDQPKRPSGALVGAERREAREQAKGFFMALMNAPIDKIAIENPIGIMSTQYRKPDQVVQPWMFGHGETKATCLWLKGLPKLEPTNIVDGREQRMHLMTPSVDRAKKRSETYTGVANAMASQWGK